MPLIVHYWGAYPGYDRQAIPLREEDWAIDCTLAAVKGRLSARSVAWVTAIDGQTHRITGGTEAAAFEVFGQWGAHLLSAWWQNSILVPVPSSDHTIFNVPFTASHLAHAIATRVPEELNIRAAPILAFKAAMPTGGAGGVSAIQDALRCSFDRLAGCSTVLIDDICVTGAHLLACARFLRSLGAEVGLALCLAKYVRSPHPNPLHVAPEDVEEGYLTSR
jgi:hypothetical protein